MLLKLLPLALLAIWLWSVLTARSRATRALMRNSRPLDDWTLLEPVRAFAKALDVPGFTVRVLDMDEVNGLALPGGEIFISRGLYEKYLAGQVSRDEIAAVIAHEIGHVALGHHARRLGAWRTETATLAALAMVLSRVAFGWLGLLLAIFGLTLFRNRLTQADEFEADAFSAQLMMRADVDPTAMIRLLQKLEGWTGQAGRLQGPVKWLLSHPPIAERIEHARAVIAAGVPNEA
ncbi:MAG: M48 family metallopeptidase [Pseudomonadota bacterium]